ncbi:MAG: hypothetical protein QM696_11335 [Steroidobacteraceae bacterium]
MSTEILKKTALRNALGCLESKGRFPYQVFVCEWTDYFFFCSDVLFERRFVEIKNLLLEEEGASAIAVVNLGNVVSDQDHPRTIFLDRDTDANAYIAELVGDGSPDSWMFLKDRYICASDQGHWSIYCEKENDIAVLAVDETISEFARSRLVKLMDATSVRAIHKSSNSSAFNFNRLVPEWRRALALQYCSPVQSD